MVCIPFSKQTIYGFDSDRDTVNPVMIQQTGANEIKVFFFDCAALVLTKDIEL